MRPRAFLFLTTLALALTTLACARGTERDAGTRERAAAAADTAAPPAAVPVVDWCAGHRVPESMCTQCNPALIAEFKARGDWCAEHELPESICPLCHPDRVKPLAGAQAAPGAVVADGAPADGVRIRFKTRDAAREAGLETATAAAGAAAAAVEATAILVADPARHAIVNVRVPGVVLEIAAGIGSRVARGGTLAVIESAGVAADVSKLVAARARVDAAAAAYRREEALFARGISAARAVERAKEEWAAAQAEVDALGAALDLAGAAGETHGRQVLVAPIAGIVTRQSAVLGKFVDSAETLFEIVDPAVLWAEIDVPEAAAPEIAPGQRVEIVVGAAERHPERVLASTLTYVAPIIDAATRTARARARLDNRGGLLRANMYARARIFVEPDSGSVLVPRSALQEVKGVQLMFVRLALDEYETRRVTARGSARHPDQVAVAAGLRPGEDVVTVGSFLLKTETLKESLGVGCCDVGPPARRES